MLECCLHLHDSVLSSRLARAILPSVTVLLATQSHAQADSDSVTLKSKNKRGKKRARGYEGDEMLKVSVEIMCRTAEEGEMLLVALDGKTSALVLFQAWELRAIHFCQRSGFSCEMRSLSLLYIR